MSTTNRTPKTSKRDNTLHNFLESFIIRTEAYHQILSTETKKIWKKNLGTKEARHITSSYSLNHQTKAEDAYEANYQLEICNVQKN